MDDVMLVVGAVLLAVGAGAVYVPAGVIVFGVLLMLGGYRIARRSKP